MENDLDGKANKKQIKRSKLRVWLLGEPKRLPDSLDRPIIGHSEL